MDRAAAALDRGASLPYALPALPRARDVITVGEDPAAPEAEALTPIDTPLDAASLTRADEAAGPSRWRTHVARLAAKYDISPALLEAVVWQESRWNEGARSHAGARGLAQLMPGTARTMGVDPDDPAANLEGGARYLRQQLDAFHGDLEKALAAYNAGPRRVAQAGGVPNIRETRAYVTAIMGRLSAPVR
ncbi:lytic transglycosylase domain-containing protein [Novosphingobium sp. 1949]|uniref:Lytic transglycosylase domain-containing protein n=1 Tax=Novosphingobium organovorum TaxID=2930092 RepID=A0ABT0BGZ5_9SPHN|nr:lytic transglycosylase domain-containing protein [Novosphingobium organovorum]MCJ2184309.1 lytic transglycosylase domain-containing protein [Novosphingobium organovorum]